MSLAASLAAPLALAASPLALAASLALLDQSSSMRRSVPKGHFGIAKNTRGARPTKPEARKGWFGAG